MVHDYNSNSRILKSGDIEDTNDLPRFPTKPIFAVTTFHLPLCTQWTQYDCQLSMLNEFQLFFQFKVLIVQYLSDRFLAHSNWIWIKYLFVMSWIADILDIFKYVHSLFSISNSLIPFNNQFGFLFKISTTFRI